MSRQNITILVIDDAPGDRRLLWHYIRRIPDLEVDFIEARSVDEGLAVLAHREIDVTFLDYRLGAETGAEVLETIRSSGDLRPVIVLTGQGDEQIASTLMRLGADDYIAKNELSTDQARRSIDIALARYRQRETEARNRQLLAQLQTANKLLGEQNARLDQLYETASRFVDDVSHEFRTPLTVIKGYTEAMLAGLGGDINDQQQEFLEIVIDRTRDLSQMVDDLLDTSKIRSGYLRVDRRPQRLADILEPIRSMIERKAATEKVRFVVEIDPNLPEVFADGEKTGRVMLNLVVNAMKFSLENSQVTLWARPLGTTDVEVGVTDQGPGITPENLKHLFQRFRQVGEPQRSSTKGFGLGLSIAKELVSLNLGRISVSSEAGVGSTFSFTLPVNSPEVIVERLCDHLAERNNPSGFVALVSLTPIASELPLDEYRGFLTSIIQPMDVVLPHNGADRVLHLLGYTTEPNTWLDRIRKAAGEAVESSPGREQLSMEMHLEHAWVFPDQRQATVEEVVNRTTGVPAVA